MTKRIVLNLLQYLLAFGVLAVMVWLNWEPKGGNGLKEVWQKHIVEGQPVLWSFLGLAAMLYAVSLIITLLRWYFLVRAQNLPFTVKDALRLGLIGAFFNSFLPGAVGGDLVKATFLAREHTRRTVAVATVIMDRVLALWGLCWFVAILGGIFWVSGLLDGPSVLPAKVIVISAATVVGVSVVVWLLLGLLTNEKAERFAMRLQGMGNVGHSAAEFWRAVWMYRCRQGAVALTLVISWIGQVGFVLSFYCSSRVLWDGTDESPLPTLAQHFLLVPIGLVVQALPGFPGGAGIGEAGFGGLYALFGCKAAGGVLASLVQRVVVCVVGTIGFVVAGYLKSKQPAASLAIEASTVNVSN